ncbi:hypothetical protein O1R50_15865 [Glycomyces luteolus]|uniref:Uncharacterized protein n=1 Tax=Glycomyces luteolus TaxID=2670330 RepID=A0A9X3SR05_9ACTN|nr:hypothetical protein [Glycomyces luteolus]MDA1361107.1 hypothetical protein [Glycomyces luteolus]
MSHKPLIGVAVVVAVVIVLSVVAVITVIIEDFVNPPDAERPPCIARGARRPTGGDAREARPTLRRREDGRLKTVLDVA